METNFETTDDMDDDAWKVDTDYHKHADHVEKLRKLANRVDNEADSMKVMYKEDSELGKVVLYLEFADEEE